MYEEANAYDASGSTLLSPGDPVIWRPYDDEPTVFAGATVLRITGDGRCLIQLDPRDPLRRPRAHPSMVFLLGDDDQEPFDVPSEELSFMSELEWDDDLDGES